MKRLTTNIAIAAVMVIASLILAACRKLGLIDGDTFVRAYMAGMGLYVAFSANLIPKAAGPVSGRCLAARRASGWTLMLAGLGYAFVGLIAPMSYAPILSTALLFAGVAAVAAYCLWGRSQAVA